MKHRKGWSKDTFATSVFWLGAVQLLSLGSSHFHCLSEVPRNSSSLFALPSQAPAQGLEAHGWEQGVAVTVCPSPSPQCPHVGVQPLCSSRGPVERWLSQVSFHPQRAPQPGCLPSLQLPPAEAVHVCSSLPRHVAWVL